MVGQAIFRKECFEPGKRDRLEIEEDRAHPNALGARGIQPPVASKRARRPRIGKVTPDSGTGPRSLRIIPAR